MMNRIDEVPCEKSDFRSTRFFRMRKTVNQPFSKKTVYFLSDCKSEAAPRFLPFWQFITISKESYLHCLLFLSRYKEKRNANSVISYHDVREQITYLK